MKINRKLFKNICITLVLFAICNQISCSNLKENKSNQIVDANATPKKTDAKPVDDNKFNIKTAIYVILRGFEQIKKLKNDNAKVYDQCLQTCVSPSQTTALKNLWTYLGTVDFQGKEDLKKEPFDKFCVESMSEEKLIVNKAKINCDDICKDTSVKNFDDNMQKDLRAIFSPYFDALDFGGSKKNIITAFIGTYRNTPLGRALPRKLNRS